MTPKGSTLRVLRAAASACAVAFSSCLALADGAHIQVRGVARIDAHTALSSGKLVVSGTVTDDAGRPSSGAEVAIGITRALKGGAVPLGLALPESCRDTSRPPTLDGTDRMLLPTDGSGRFCVRLSLPKERYVANFEVRASGPLDGASLELPLDLSLKPVTLRFDPEQSVLDLDDDTNDIAVVASTEEDGVTTPASALWLALTNENGTALGGAMTGTSGRARLIVPGSSSTRLGQPGKGVLRAAFAGNADLGPSACAIPVERHTRVELTVPDARDGRRAVGSPEDEIAIRVVATARCARLGCSAEPTGTVEARLGDAVVGAATLDRGQARVVVTFPMAAAEEVPLHLRYVPDAPWFRPAADVEVDQPVRGQSAWRGLPLALAGLGAIAWLMMARLPRRFARGLARASRPRPLRGGAHVELLRGESSSQGWRGQVIDADERDPVAGARASVERRGFERTDVVARATSDAEGMFALPPLETLPGDELVVDAPLHAVLRGPLPPTGELRVALVLRRRALLDRLVTWARRRGVPFDARPDPTPAHVRHAAGPDVGIARWANAIERAAYAGDVVDEQAEGDVDRLAPVEDVDPKARDEREGQERAKPKRPRR